MTKARSTASRVSESSVLDVRCNRRQLLVGVRADGTGTFLFLPTNRQPEVGASVTLQIDVVDIGERLTVPALITSHHSTKPTAGAGTDIGVEVSFEGDAKRQVAQMLARASGRPVELGTARMPRLDRKIGCSIEVGSKKVAGEVKDLSSNGAFIAAPDIVKLRVGAQVRVRLRSGMFGMSSQTVHARVVWFGAKDGAIGFGARFTDGPHHIAQALGKHLK